MRPAGSERRARTARRRGDTQGSSGSWRDVLVAVDVGTSGARAAAFDLDGHRQIEVRRGFTTSTPRPAWAEQDALAWRSASLSALRELVARVGPQRRVHAIALTGQCPSVVLIDADGRPVRPGLIYRDNRATAEAAELRQRLGSAGIHRQTGHVPAAFHVLPKLMWLARHEPDAFARARLALQPRDWLALVLTGEAATDGSHAAATLAYDLAGRRWSPAIASEVGIDVALFPGLSGSAAVAGQLRSSVARRVGLSASTPVVLGGADSQACALGVGVVAPGPVSEMAGSSTCLNAALPAPLASLAVTHYPHVVGDGLTTETGINTAGAAVRWLADLAFAGRRGRAGGSDFERLDAEAGAVPAGADGVLGLAVLGDGERTDESLRGALVGLSLRHSRGTLARALLEAVAFSIRAQLELLTGAGVPVTELRVSGGDARLATWNRIKADVIGVPVRVIPGDAAVTGVAMLAALGAGIYTDTGEAIAACVRPDPAIEPDARAARVYDAAFERWRALVTSSVVRAPETP
jgi:xylulokinase